MREITNSDDLHIEESGSARGGSRRFPGDAQLDLMGFVHEEKVNPDKDKHVLIGSILEAGWKAGMSTKEVTKILKKLKL
jgi:hypothetical protein